MWRTPRLSTACAAVVAAPGSLGGAGPRQRAGGGPHAGDVVHGFSDGSTGVERYRGAVRLAEDGRTTVAGEFECVGGTGRLAGRKGRGRYRGERLGSLATGNSVDIDFESHCTTP